MQNGPDPEEQKAAPDKAKDTAKPPLPGAGT